MKDLYRYHFGRVCFDEAQPSLTVDGQPVHLQARQRKLLSCLLARPGKVIGRDELLDRVWGYNAEAKDHALTTAIDRLRRALGEPDGASIRTVHGQGYQFTGSATREVVGTEVETRLSLAPGDPMPHRPGLRLHQLLGRSTACEVWAAEDSDGHARRIYKLGVDAQGLREIRRESRLLAHVHRVLGERDDLARALATHLESAPYWIELEDGGQPLDRWAVQTGWFDHAELAPRLALFLAVAGAVAALHGAALIHADIKPANILTRTDGAGAARVRLIDFGSGHVVTALLREGIQDLRESLMLPGSSDPTRGTYRYFAPELWRGAQPTVQSDIYALGVLLYQLLVGDFNARPEAGWERQLDDPLLVEDVRRAVDGDPDRRFGSVQELIRALQQLDARREAQRDAAAKAALQARIEQENQQLRLEKLRLDARRPAVRAAIGLLCLALLTTSALWWTVRARNQELVSHRAEMGVLNRFLDEDLIGSADPALVGRKGMTVVDAALQAATVVDRKYAHEPPGVRALIHADLQRTLGALTRYDDALVEGQRALAALQEAGGGAPELEAEIQVRLASSRIQKDQLPQAREALARAAALLPDAATQASENAVRYWLTMSNLHSREFRMEEAVKAALQARQTGSQLAGLPARLADQIDFNLGDMQKLAGQLDAAAATFTALHERQARRDGPRHPLTCYTAVGMAVTFSAQDRVAEGRKTAREAFDCLSATLGADDRRTLIALDVLATLHYRADDYAAAAAAWTQALDVLLPQLGEQSVRIINLRSNVARCWMWRGQDAQAERLFREELARVRLPRGEMDPLVQSLRYETAHALLNQGRPGDAAALLDGLDPSALGKVALADDWPARLQFERGRLARLQGDQAGAQAAFEQVKRLLQGKGEDARIPAALLAELLAPPRH